MNIEKIKERLEEDERCLEDDEDQLMLIRDHCRDIQTLLSSLEVRDNEIKALEGLRMSLRNEITELQTLFEKEKERVDRLEKSETFVTRNLFFAQERALKAEERVKELEGEIVCIDELLARRDALDNEPTRQTKILKAIKTAKRVDQLESLLEKEKERVDRTKHDHEVALALRDAMRERVKELLEFNKSVSKLYEERGRQVGELESNLKELEEENETHLRSIEIWRKNYWYTFDRLKNLMEAVEKHHIKHNACIKNEITEMEMSNADEEVYKTLEKVK